MPVVKIIIVMQTKTCLMNDYAKVLAKVLYIHAKIDGFRLIKVTG
ncbi:hypothetical protein VII00023_02034 [Vibrio ichthyoenteri ATCC 700023]|uniref:Uncharacterized protein n=1 Tax=Vibrio ichthyoenteri ATCC 700023 TaxID=870968 RepID=F9RY16_9VIBR|nr:hypothetical protein VII00023_02034 [Vibrio ichthyoenteri ATCC 700023]